MLEKRKVVQIFKDGSKGGFESEISSKGAIQAGGNETKSSLAQTLSGDAEEEGGEFTKIGSNNGR